MGKAVNENGDASRSERESLAVVAALMPARLTVVLRPPSGGRGAGGGSTSDLVVYQGEGENRIQVATIDVYTPESSTDPKQIGKMVERKLGSQASGMCVDFVKVPAPKRGRVKDRLEEIAENAYIVVHVNGQDAEAYGNRPG